MKGVKGKFLFVFLVLFLPAAIFAAQLVNINTADLTTLETLSGIGPSKAQAIIDYRTQHGPFATIDDIKNVSGIGTATYNNIKDYITVGDTTQTQSIPTQDQSQTQSATTSQTQTQNTPSPAPVSSYVAPPSPTLFADVGPDRVVIVGADTQFDARAYDKDRNVLDTGTVRFLWNFGDGSTAEGESVLHHYQYPGTYALVLNIAQDKFAAMDEAVVVAEPAKLAFSVMADGGAQINNLAGRDLDLSGWLIRAGAGLLPPLFTLPPHSVILAGSSMHIARATLGFAATADAELQYPNGVEALHAGQASVEAPSVPPSAASDPAPRPIASAKASSLVPTASAAEIVTSAGNLTDNASSESEVAAAGNISPGSSKVWWIVAVGLAGAAAVALVIAQRFGKKEWDIVEETGE